ncbi:RING finger protein 17 isoform X1 [Monodelphis domestica]|uniref:RING finger protein 17 n=1 Tax=Monodelphis domestica TaxID=13616 RepID=F7ETJ9_MONDO|nr:RING finger protein 17 isoform X1 [Monodelphis domestica]
MEAAVVPTGAAATAGGMAGVGSSTARLPASSSSPPPHRLPRRKSRLWGPTEVLCSGCGRSSVAAAAGHHHELQCGHAYCELCLSVTEEYSTVVCPDCEVVTTINKKQGYYPLDGYVEEDAYEEKFQPKKIRNCSQDFKKTACQQIVGLENSSTLHRPILNPSSVVTETKMTQELDEALKIAGYNFEQLSAAEKMLECLENQTKQETDSLLEVLEEKFHQLFTSLKSRKRSLYEEVVRNTEDYLGDIIMAKKYIEGKKNDLDAAMRIARELKMAPSLRTYCDLNQIIRTLKLAFESELSEVSSLKFRSSPRLNLNCNEIVCIFKNMGKIEFEETSKFHSEDKEGTGQNLHKYTNKKEFLNCDAYLSVEKNKFEITAVDDEVQPLMQHETGDTRLESKSTQHQDEKVSVSSPKTAAVLPQMGSSPDVIIEEIIEEDQETYFIEHIMEAPRHQKKPLQKKSVPLGLKAGSLELVFVSHVIHPCHFYIRKYSQRKNAAILEKKLNHFCNKSLYLSSSDILELGAKIFVNSIENGMWCRGTITELIPIENKNVGKPCGPTKYPIRDVALIQVFMIDFGNSEVLVISGIGDGHIVRPGHSALQHLVVNDLCLVIRKPDSYIEALLGDLHPLALPCSLKDIVPQNSNEGWGEDAKMEFLKMVNNKAVLMKVFREEDGVLIVDLKKPPANKISSDMPVSLRDALVFMELARFRSQSPSIPSEKNMTLRYHPPVLPKELSNVSVVVCHINNPSDFYLQLIESLDFLVLLKKIEEVYKNEDGENLEILCPVQGQACIAKFEDGVWYRAQVIGLPGRREVEVKYVDFGNAATVTLKEMRKVKDEFLSPPEKAIKCKLAHIEPSKKNKPWSKEANEKFEEMTHDKFMTCSVIKILEDNVLSVELFDSISAPGMIPNSVNSQLVKEGLASYELGYTLKGNCKKYDEVWDPSPEEIISTETNISNSLVTKFLEDQDLQLLYNKEIPVQISNVVSPEKIYVQQLSTETLLNSLQEKMTTAYENSKCEPVLWETNMYCAVKMAELKQWRRGQILKIISETLVEVMLYDFGIKVTVNVDCLRKLEENLKTTKNLALECSLVDIRPTGGSDKWTATACDCLSFYLTGAVASVIIQENHTTWPLPVKILCRDEKGQCIDISNYLIKKGLALRERRIDKINKTDSSSEKNLDIPMEQENGGVTKCATSHFELNKVNGIIGEHKVSDIKKAVLDPRTRGCYKPPVIPNMKVFEAVVSCIGDDGTIYVVPKSSELELRKLMDEIQSNFKCLGLLEPYCWKKGEACAVRGSDTVWYRGKVMEVVGGTIRVQYLDHGYTEKIPQCHLYPIVLYADRPQFCIPCQLYNTVPIGNFWQPDAVELLQELLPKREVEIHNMELPENPWGKLSVHLYFDGMSLSYFMAHHKHCTFEGSEEILKEKSKDHSEKYEEENWEIIFKELLRSDTETPVLPPYLSPSLPPPGELYPVQVKHVVSPNEVYICLDLIENFNHQNETTDNGVTWESEPKSLDEVLQRCNQNVDSLPSLTDFRSEMPCLAEYNDGLWYRAKILSIKEFDPLAILVQFVDYGSTEKLPTSRLRQIPIHLMKYPARAVKVLLAGFKPPLKDSEKTRIPYCPKWSMEAMWAMIDCLQGKQLYASSLTQSPEYIVTLYEDEQYPVHMSLIEMGLADLDE